MAQSDKYFSLVKEMEEEFPGFRVYDKSTSALMKLIYHVMLMRFWNRDFMDAYVTAFGNRVWMPPYLIGSLTGYEILRHERVHLRDASRWPIIFELSYLFLPLPFIFTVRAFWEFRAYCESLRVEAEMLGYVRRDSLDFYVKQFTGSYYLWMCPFPNYVMKKFVKFLEREGLILK